MGLLKEFFDFVWKGDIIDLSVGVVIGGAFNDIIKAITKIIVSLVSWPIPGGIKGLITVLPAVTVPQKGLRPEVKISEDEGLGQKFMRKHIQEVSEALAKFYYGSADPTVVELAKQSIVESYDLHGGKYTYKLSAIIDWAALISSIISFIIVAITLFALVKCYSGTKTLIEKVSNSRKSSENPSSEGKSDNDSKKKAKKDAVSTEENEDEEMKNIANLMQEIVDKLTKLQENLEKVES